MIMKTFASLLLAICLSASLAAQTGIYMTYDDFKAGKLLKADNKELSIKTKHEITMKTGGETKTFETKDFYAMLLDGELYRFSPTAMGNIYLKLQTVDDHYALWMYSETRYSSGGGGSHTNAIYYLSKGLDGKMTDISMNGQLKALESDSDFKDLVGCIQKKGKLTMMRPLVRSAAECIAEDPTYKKDPKSVIPAIK